MLTPREIRAIEHKQYFTLVKQDGYHFYMISENLVELFYISFDKICEFNYIIDYKDTKYTHQKNIYTALVLLNEDIPLKEKYDLYVKYYNKDEILYHALYKDFKHTESVRFVEYNYKFNYDHNSFPLFNTILGYTLNCLKNKLISYTSYKRTPIIGHYNYNKKRSYVLNNISTNIMNNPINGYIFKSIVYLLRDKSYKLRKQLDYIDCSYSYDIFNDSYTLKIKSNIFNAVPSMSDLDIGLECTYTKEGFSIKVSNDNTSIIHKKDVIDDEFIKVIRVLINTLGYHLTVEHKNVLYIKIYEYEVKEDTDGNTGELF